MASYNYSNIEIMVEEGQDGLFGVKITDLSTHAIWWETICETEEDAYKAIKSIFENQSMLDLQKKLNSVKVIK